MADPLQRPEEVVNSGRITSFFWPEASRLEAAIRTERFELERLKQQGKKIDTILPLLEKAAFALKKGNIDLGWRCVKIARRALIFLLPWPKLHGRAVEMFHEAEEKIDSEWRRKTMLDLLRPLLPEIVEEAASPDSKAAKKEVAKKQAAAAAVAAAARAAGAKPKKKAQEKKARKTPASQEFLNDARVRVHLAAELRDEHFNNIYFKNSILRRYQTLVLAALMIFVATIIFFGALEIFPFKEGKDAWKLLFASAVFGLLGSSFSSIRALVTEVRKLTKARIPKQGLQAKTLFIRLFIGASAGLVAYILLASGIVNPGGQNPEELSQEYYYFFAFVSGFSDRLILQGIEAIAKQESKRESGGSSPSGTAH